MKEIMINNERIILRKGITSDSKSLIEYLNIIGGESDFLTFGADGYQKTIEQIESFIESTSKKDNTLFIVAEINGKVIGNLNFSAGLSPRITHIGEFGVSVLKNYWGNGIGEELIKYLIEWSKKSGIIRKINLRVRTDNQRGINLYKKLGFLQEGILTRDFLINGKFYDSMAMGLIID